MIDRDLSKERFEHFQILILSEILKFVHVPNTQTQNRQSFQINPQALYLILSFYQSSESDNKCKKFVKSR